MTMVEEHVAAHGGHPMIVSNDKMFSLQRRELLDGQHCRQRHLLI